MLSDLEVIVRRSGSCFFSEPPSRFKAFRLIRF